MSEKITVYCVVCGEKLKVYASAMARGQAEISCPECVALAKTRFAPSERRAIRKFDRLHLDQATQQASPKIKTPVIAESLSEYVRWLVQKRYSRRDYVFCELGVGLNSYGSDVFIFLPGAKKRSDWNGVNNYIMSHTPALVIE